MQEAHAPHLELAGGAEAAGPQVPWRSWACSLGRRSDSCSGHLSRRASPSGVSGSQDAMELDAGEQFTLRVDSDLDSIDVDERWSDELKSGMQFWDDVSGKP